MCLDCRSSRVPSRWRGQACRSAGEMRAEECTSEHKIDNEHPSGLMRSCPHNVYLPSPLTLLNSKRTVGTSALRNLDPYLMLDELKLPAKKAFAGQRH